MAQQQKGREDEQHVLREVALGEVQRQPGLAVARRHDEDDERVLKDDKADKREDDSQRLAELSELCFEFGGGLVLIAPNGIEQGSKGERLPQRVVQPLAYGTHRA